ncbi:MAG TPA: hypothetical protein VF731_00550 [Solirubrobacterales bacterium]
MGGPGRTCAVCGRTILAGERVRGYVSEAGPKAVCELCVARAERLGWLTEEELERRGELATGPGQRRRGLGGLLRRRDHGGAGRSRGGGPDRRFEEEHELPDEELELPEEFESDQVELELEASPDPAAPGRRPASPAPDAFMPSPFERAVTRFNASEPGRTVVGLTRTLGRPWVSVGAMAGAPSEIRITVAWELSWYQWGVDLGDELRPVFQVDKGQEISQIDAAARQWNASVDEEGRIVLSTPAGAGARPR